MSTIVSAITASKREACPGVFIDEMNLLDALADILQEQLDTTLGQYSLGLEQPLQRS